MEIKFGKEYESNYVTFVKAGRYEGFIKKAEINRGRKGDGKERLEITLLFRNDVEQENKGQLISYLIFPIENDSAYNFKKINNIICTQLGLPTCKAAFNTVDEIVQYLNGLYLSFEIENSFDDFYGEDRSRVKDYRFSAPVSVPVKTEPVKTEPVKVEPVPTPAVTTGDDLPW